MKGEWAAREGRCVAVVSSADFASGPRDATFGHVRLLFIGDVVGRPGREAVRILLPRLRQELDVAYVVANGENSAGGAGITLRTAAELFSAGVDVITTGDHVWDQREAAQLLEQHPRVLRPINYPPGVPGRGSCIVFKDGLPPLAVINAQGRTFMPVLENPFLVVPAEVERLRRETRVILIDFHAEATSEKIAFGRLLDGQVSAVLGTHTHVPTADEQIFPGGTAYLTDAGFTGPQESVLGREISAVIRRFQTQCPQRFEVARERVMLLGALLEVDPTSGRALWIRRVAESVPADLSPADAAPSEP
ncbi:MAG: TIGR00282 family metallophosphoesterase [Verrucomicrobiota bacterium]|nr:TIGR00282 family metallophosphoesterase [Limisphaera sp.]MDW8382114.1 TIGR00282 family metallophosphoesterase [Verrucomicrobiota bacterium]